MQRREFLKTLPVGAFVLTGTGCATDNKTVPADDWARAALIEASIQVTEFPDRDFSVEDFGARADGESDSSLAINRAIAHCHAAGGGRVLLSEGVYRSGAIHLLSNVNLHVAAGSKIHFFTDPKKYLPAVLTRWEGMEIMGYSPLIYAYKQDNIAITGAGILDGGADDQTWWPWKGKHSEQHWDLIPGEDQKPARDRLQEDVLRGVPVAERLYADGSFLRPAFVQPYACTRVLIEGVSIVRSPFWLVNPVLCESVTVRGITCTSHGPNNDGCDPESCNLVLIEDCLFDTGDDCIALKSGRNEDGRRIGVPIQNVLIRNCAMRDGHGGLVIGSEISGGARNIFMEDCTMNSPHLERAFRFKTNARRGGVIEHVRVRNVKIGQVQEALVVNFFYEEGDKGQFLPQVNDLVIENVECKQAERVFHLRGFKNNPVGAITVRNSSFEHVSGADVIEYAPQLTLENVRR
ncbi:glycoside hydrolase family 28 protein [Simiduia curdlanivorans]|uniref:Glycoside hydrolase family 28 protein n=1 Tax=Simiduia curdlanivorans TaxID=1492769 RepID=A0ABV8V3W8_9GAMM|nr:glycoside hydrolase family 28 protein [Simiduia curdlanivorans]MDN3637551.1 glycoside hydrolase family 28 protein [Simiduia curdlanivorans]